MRKIILGLAVSLDGYIEGPNGEFDWCFTDQDYGMNAFFNRIDTIFIGRKSYELMLKMPSNDFEMPKYEEYVFSNTLTTVEGDRKLIAGDLASQVNAIKSTSGKDIWLFGGASLLDSLLKLKLVDELWLSVHPILLGTGKRLFSTVDNRIQLKLLESINYNTGLVSLRYQIC
jgi:dihydrofolate reductase